MKRRLALAALAVATLPFLCLGTEVSARMGADSFRQSLVSTEQNDHPVARPFKLKGAGQIDLTTLAFEFSGVATHLGRYSASGVIDPSTFQIQGAITAANGDTLDWSAQFSQGPLGEIEATFTFTGGTGRFEGATGTASGPVLLDADFMFTLNLQGTIAY